MQPKFRGLIESQNSGMPNTPTKKWVYGSLVVEPSRTIIQWVDDHNIVRAEIVVTSSVGQSTGHLDRKGIEIFSGDIVQLYRDYGDRIGPPRIIEWRQTRTYTGFNIGSPGVCEQEIVGNVSEDGEYLP